MFNFLKSASNLSTYEHLAENAIGYTKLMSDDEDDE